MYNIYGMYTLSPGIILIINFNLEISKLDSHIQYLSEKERGSCKGRLISGRQYLNN
jgi:hypothetical protein